MARAATAKIDARETPSNVFPLRLSEIKIADSSLPPKVKRKKITFVDLFCGAGGFTTGAYRAFGRLGFQAEGLTHRKASLNDRRRDREMSGWPESNDLGCARDASVVVPSLILLGDAVANGLVEARVK